MNVQSKLGACQSYGKTPLLHCYLYTFATFHPFHNQSFIIRKSLIIMVNRIQNRYSKDHNAIIIAAI